ncbi:3-deoxy-D-manno-octulosonic-acid transferase [Pseudoalteromonas luteoviolacea B = ATCC 29581]|nr:3-deoxy-D-manno-octulosonic-acid transferase [Pseudoalteromonas luteoviolacea B = ATCC 29581]
MARLLYSVLLVLISPLLIIYLWGIRGKKQPAYRQHFRERFAYSLSHLPKHSVLFHCASVGEVLAATPLIKQFIKQNPSHPIIITCNTPTGRAQIEANFGEQVHSAYLPIDFYHATRRFIRILKPKLVCILETELWPNLIAQAKSNNINVLVLNARLSEKSFKGYKRAQALSHVILQSISILACHNKDDAQRFMRLGLNEDKIVTTGSIKFDIQLNELEKAKIIELKKQFAQRPVWVAGSTHPIEHEKVIAAHKLVLETQPNALLIIAPRHPEQFNAVATLLEASTLRFLKRSSEVIKDNTQVLLADTLGELKCLYGVGNVAFIGGSLIARGGHNPLEAAASEVGVLTGPHTYNFAHIYPVLFDKFGAIEVDDIDSLANHISHLFKNNADAIALGKNAFDVLRQNQGAIAKTITIIEQQLGQPQ